MAEQVVKRPGLLKRFLRESFQVTPTRRLPCPEQPSKLSSSYAAVTACESLSGPQYMLTRHGHHPGELALATVASFSQDIKQWSKKQTIALRALQKEIYPAVYLSIFGLTSRCSRNPLNLFRRAKPVAVPPEATMQRLISVFSDIFFFGSLEGIEFAWDATLLSRHVAIGAAEYNPNTETYKILMDPLECLRAADPGLFLLGILLHECTHSFFQMYVKRRTNGMQALSRPTCLYPRRNRLCRCKGHCMWKTRHCLREMTWMVYAHSPFCLRYLLTLLPFTFRYCCRIHTSSCSDSCHAVILNTLASTGHGEAFCQLASHIEAIAKKHIGSGIDLGIRMGMSHEFMASGYFPKEDTLQAYHSRSQAMVRKMSRDCAVLRYYEGRNDYARRKATAGGPVL